MTVGIDNKEIELLPKRWQSFISKGMNALTVEPETWKDHQILFYLLHRFKISTGHAFACQYDKAPTSSRELHFIKAMKAMLGTTNGLIIKQYIDWVFDFKLPANKTKLRSFAFFNVAGLANQFLAWRHASKTVSKSASIPPEWRSKAEECGVEVETYGDVAFIEMAVHQGSADRQHQDFYEFILKNGFKSTALEVA